MNEYDQWLRQQSRPVTQQQQPKATGTIVPFLINVALAAVIVWLLMMRQSTPEPGPGPAPLMDVVELAEKASHDYAENLAAIATKIADKVKSGEAESRQDVQEINNRYAIAARTRAFAPIDLADNKHMPETQWDEATKQQVESYFRDIAEGHMRAAK